MEASKYKELRQMMVEALKRELIGPDHNEEDIINEPPTQAYLTGILYPSDKEDVEEDWEELSASAVADEEIDKNDKSMADDVVEKSIKGRSKKLKKQSTMGIRFYTSQTDADFNILIRWGKYEKTEEINKEGKKKVKYIRKSNREEIIFRYSMLDNGTKEFEVAEHLKLVVICRSIKNTDNLLFSVFLRNTSTNKEDTFFQVEIEVFNGENKAIFLAENIARSQSSNQPFEEFVYRNKPVFAKGFGCAANWEAKNEEYAYRLKTEFIPTHEINKMTTELSYSKRYGNIPENYLSIKYFSEETDSRKIIERLNNLADRYEEWIENLILNPISNKPEAIQIIQNCKFALQRIRNGINLLYDKKIFEAFIFMNKVMHVQSAMRAFSKNKTTLEEEINKEHFNWRPFQLAFILLNLEGIVKPHSKDREIVDLLWFPTGGGKTEAYLGLSAFLLGYRRLTASANYPFEKDGGVTILIRYTLRLLTTQQRDRLLRMICASEYIRQNDMENRFGKSEYSVGFWVGGQVTANDLIDLSVSNYKKEEQIKSEYKKLKTQVLNCPCCGSNNLNYKILPDEDVNTNKSGFKIFCNNDQCYFSKTHIPVYLIDEEIYRKLPSVIISTVDKFTRLPWDERTAALFGKINRYCEQCGYIAEGEDHSGSHRKPKAAVYQVKPFQPPELIIQDELHLITGPLGSIYGGYETAVEELCSYTENGKKIKPKYIVATATIQNADEQVKRLYARRNIRQFPPSGLEIEDSFFAKEFPAEEEPFRLYSGICVSGHSMKTVLVRVYSILLQFTENLKNNPEYSIYLDPYRTLIGYFNSVRELGGTVRLLDDDIKKRLLIIKNKYQFESQRYIRKYRELTSRIPSYQIPQVLSDLENEMGNEELDVVLATNMISVGMDIDRLGLMVVVGQPKQTSEYIQATSRVGRKYPGLVVTVYNPYRPRDMSHYQNFKGYHNRLYYHVEGTTATPYSSRARDRVLHAIAVALLRLENPALATNKSAKNIKSINLSELKKIIEERTMTVERKNVNDTLSELNNFLDNWIRDSELQTELEYHFSTFDKQAVRRAGNKKRLLRRQSDIVLRETERLTLDSMREIETSSSLKLYDKEWWLK
ncbi:DISARM system helicase DrmA [Ureibacillus thermosphaericus]|uniref:DISARM system helicase DrmA n=1 Tax=Ureibacillus thermosphaericus TaxID=51173 RepID=UPI0002E47B54|nr:DISARM system helicase DrmA [Ureibacillus thermosphaericus]